MSSANKRKRSVGDDPERTKKPPAQADKTHSYVDAVLFSSHSCADTLQPQISISDCIETLRKDDEPGIIKLLANAARKHPQVEREIRIAHASLVEKKQSQIISFDHYSSQVWRLINNKSYDRLRDSEEFERSIEVVHDIELVIKRIGSKAQGKFVSFGTKQSALETLRKIGKSICLSVGSIMAREVRKHFQMSPVLTEAMGNVIADWGDDERMKMLQIHDGRSTFLEKMVELDEFWKDYCMVGELGEIIDAMHGTSEEAGD